MAGDPKIDALARQIRDMETRTAGETGFALESFLGPMLAGGKLPPGSLIEVIGAGEGAGAWTFALLLARDVCGARALVIVDPQRTFYPPGAVKLGIDLERVVLIRPRTMSHVFSSMNRTLCCPAVGTVIGWCEQLKASDNQRLRLAAEEGGGLGILLRPAEALTERSFATIRLQLQPVATTQRQRHIEVKVLRCPGDIFGRTFYLEIDDETGSVRVLPTLAAATPPARPAHPA